MNHIPINPNEENFIAYAKQSSASVIPLLFKVANDGLFAGSIFAQLERNNRYAFLLESATIGEHSRYSFMGACPRRLFTLRAGTFTVTTSTGDCLTEQVCTDPISDLALQLRHDSSPTDEGLPPFLGGVVGYLGYDCVHYFEPIGEMKTDELDIPDMLWMQTDLMIIVDHYQQTLYLVKSCYREDYHDDWQRAYQDGRQDIEAWLRDLENIPPTRLSLPSGEEKNTMALPKSNHTPQSFAAVVEQAKAHIRCGDAFQIVPSQRFSFPQTMSALDIYRGLRHLNPSPYMFHLRCDNFSVVGASPELMLSCQGKQLRVRPIAGTKPRGNNAAEDAALEAQLRTDEKEIAEHMMLVDLGRNDLGRVASIGSVTVPEEYFCQIQRYSHVIHMESVVDALLADGLTSLDALRATFPAGTLSGAPKVRAMQIINDLEACKRNLYGGCVGYIGHNGDMMTCIAIRTLIAKDNTCYVQAGSGIVADSIPEKEYQESVNKAMAALRVANR